jgi:hypothetical protein
MTPDVSPPGGAWRRLAPTFLGVLVLCFALVAAFVFTFDPFGVGPLARRDRVVLMDLNQRFMYPQVVRSGRFDAAVTGTSTVRLLNPEVLDRAFDARFANLAMNSATAWEQTRILDLFLREVKQPRALIMGLDPLWCAEDATSEAKRLTFRAFPASFYDDNPLNDWPELFNLKAIEIAWRMVLHRLGRMPERLRADGYEVFTPAEASYDLAKARQHIYGGSPRTIEDRPPYQPSAAERAGWQFPALAWLEGLVARLPQGAPVLLVFPPNHLVGQAPSGSPAEARDEACKRAVAAIAERHGATVVDFRIRSQVTREDANYWDPLHYRLPIAERMMRALADAARTGRDDPAGFYRVLASPHRGS